MRVSQADTTLVTLICMIRLAEAARRRAQSAKAACVSANEAARAVEAAANAGDTVQALYKTSIAASRAATARPAPLQGRACVRGVWALAPERGVPPKYPVTCTPSVRSDSHDHGAHARRRLHGTLAVHT